MKNNKQAVSDDYGIQIKPNTKKKHLNKAVNTGIGKIAGVKKIKQKTAKCEKQKDD